MNRSRFGTVSLGWAMADVMRIENTSDIALPTSHI
jgi:hypothetical protein